MEPETIRYRAVMRLAYSVALLALLEYAHESGEEFSYGPLLADSSQCIQALEEQGLTVTGPDLSGVRKILGDIPGLYLCDS